MNETSKAIRLLLIGVGPRLAIALAVVVALWLGFFWATATPGAR